MTLLPPLRVLDLTDGRGLLCGRVLGDLGADVIKIERPGGDSARNIGPFYQDIPSPEKSLYWFFYGANRRSVTLNIESGDGKFLLERMIKTADILLESFPPGYLDNLGLGYNQLTKLNSQLIVTSITPFGQNGPYSGYKSCDLVLEAISGQMYFTGDPDRPPLRISVPQAHIVAGAQAAAGTLIAYYARSLTGKGQHVDVSAQESLTPLMAIPLATYDIVKEIITRQGVFRKGVAGQAAPRLLWTCKDGYIAFELMGTKQGIPSCKGVTQWMDSEGIAGILKEVDWDHFDRTKVTQEEQTRLEEAVSQFFLRHTRVELFQEARRRNIMLFPVNTPEELFKDEQLSARGFWQNIEHPELGTTITYPGSFVRTSEVACSIRRRAPLIGEHNEEIYAELGLTPEELATLKSSGVI